jgi:N-acetylglucosamine kinase-like BadF-type ATPase
MGGEPRVDDRFLGIEGGGTRTVALLANVGGAILSRLESGPLNLKLSTDAAVLHRPQLWRYASPAVEQKPINPGSERLSNGSGPESAPL